MPTATIPSEDRLSPALFQRLALFIQRDCGIRLPESKKTMVEGRLRRRVIALGMERVEDYCRYVLDHGGMTNEYFALIGAITTNKTDFFREPVHYQYLARNALPELIAAGQVSRGTPLKAWSAASSTGAEAYTMAMVLADLTAEHDFCFSILGTDICHEVLCAAQNAVYPEAMISPVPMDLRCRYLLRSKHKSYQNVRIVPGLRRCVDFAWLNLTETPYRVPRDMHVIFCRNVLIYFEKVTQQKVLAELCRHLRPGGYLFLGHSECLSGPNLPLTPVASTIFRRT